MKSRVVLVISILLALVFLFAGGSKVVAPGTAAKAFQGYGYAIWFMYVVAIWELIGGVMLLISVVRFYGAILLAVDMAGAFFTLLRASEYTNALLPLILFILLVWVAYRCRPSAARATPVAV